MDTKAPVTVQSLLKSVDKVKKSKAEGYPEDTNILHTKLPASVFMASENPALILQDAYEVSSRSMIRGTVHCEGG